MTFDPDDPRLTAFALGELDEDDRPAVEALVSRSPEAARFVAEVRETAAWLSQTLRSEPAPGLSIVQRIDLDARIGGDASRRARRRFRVRRVLSGLAAALALAAGGFGVGRLSTTARPLGHEDAMAIALNSTPAPPASSTRSAADSGLDPMSDFEPSAMIALESESLSMDRSDRGEALARREARDGGPAAFDVRAPVTEETSPLASATEPLMASAEPNAPAATLAFSQSRGMPPAAPAPDPAAAPAPSPAARGGAAGAEAMAEAETTLVELAEPSAGRERDAFGRASESPTLAARTQEQGQGQDQEQKQEPSAEPPASAPDGIPRTDGASVASGAGAEAEAGMMAGAGLTTPFPTAPRPSRAAKVAADNIVEVLDQPDGEPVQRLALGVPVRAVDLDQTGTRMLATASDRSISVIDVDSGLLLNSVQVERGPVPDARFGPRGEVILSNLVDPTGPMGTLPGSTWRLSSAEPIAALPIRPGSVPLSEVASWLAGGRLPIDRPVPVAALVNAPAYPFDRPEGGEAVSVDTRVVSCPWDDRHRLVRIALIAREANADAGAADRVAEGVAAEVEFNPARVASYRPIGFDGRPSPAGSEPEASLSAGESCSLLFEIRPAGEGQQIARRARAFRYQGPPSPSDPEARQELLTITLSYREPGGEERITVEHPVPDTSLPITQAPDEVRLAAAIAWFGLTLAGALPDANADPAPALDGASALVRSCDDGFLPADRATLLDLLARARTLPLAPPPDAAPSP
ncbi:YfbK domain-containing protein [Tautonia sociabilis]|uniref:DUF3520 domain-containing protein n=1 Tax=Tautonia sociabilis TaxID=2080755 RepID=A0A432MF88_9BACT|nr:YfbK domain-containing protein [Tautonia sociabilis]RUL84626.1 DUF3520 domain-containing protein [Tautonia sociabilis]